MALTDLPAAPAPAVFVTRPEREAQLWVQALQDQGWTAHALPLIDIGPAPDPAALGVYRARTADFAAVMFVSANAVEGFFLAPGPAWPACTQAWATGPGTARALVAAGVPTTQIEAPGPQAPQLDSEALWGQVGSHIVPGQQVLIVRGGDATGQSAGRDWLVLQLEAAGVGVATVVAYVRRPPTWDAAQRQRALAGAAPGSWWLFSSSEAVTNLQRLLPGQDWSAAGALCTHPRIAQAAQACGFARVAQVQSGPQAVAAFLQSVS